MKLNKIPAEFLFRLGVGFILVYYGLLGLLDPQIIAAVWLSGWAVETINYLIPIDIFIIIFSVIQLIVGLLTVLNLYQRYVLPIIMLILLGIIINLGASEIALRDAVILTGVIYMYLNKFTNH